MFMSVFMLLLSSLMVCGFDGEINGGDYVDVIYFDAYNFVSVECDLFVAHLEFVSGTSGVKWELMRHAFALLALLFSSMIGRCITLNYYHDIYKRKKEKKEKVFYLL